MQQCVELCMVVDKEKSGMIQMSNFLRISQVCGLTIENTLLLKHTNQRQNVINYSQLTSEMLAGNGPCETAE